MADMSQAQPWLKKYPPELDWNASIPCFHAFKLLDDAAQEFPDRPFLDFYGHVLTYREGAALVERLAAGLQQMGISKGERVGLFLPNCTYFPIAYYAILKIGAVVVNLNPLYIDREIVHHLSDAGIKTIFTLDMPQMLNKLDAVFGRTPLERIIVCPLADILPFPKNLLYPLVRRKDVAKWRRDARHLGWKDALAIEGSHPKAVEIDPLKDLAVLQYTGGTTGVSKGAMLTHANIYANAEQSRRWFVGANPGHERMLGVIPFFHVFAMTAVMNLAIRLGSEIIMLPKFDLDEVMHTIHRRKPTLFPAVPTLYTAISHHPKVKNYDLSSIRMCLSGGAPLPVEVKQGFEKITGCKVVEGYGLSETSPVVTCNPMFGENRTGSIGLPLPGTTVSIRSLEDPIIEMPLGERGEVCIKGPQVMAGYWNRPDETASVMLPGGFLRTGDVGIMDADGYTSIVDRIKDMIICSGFNVYPRNVEEALYLHPGVAEVIVAGVPDEYRGQTVKAYIVPKPGYTLAEEDLTAFLKDKLSPIERPKLYEFRTSLPKTMVGKLSRKALLEEEAAKAASLAKGS